MMRSKDRFRGCLCGGAVGDALGYPVAQMEDSDIFQRFGESGITQLIPNAEGRAEISAYTQLTLFTANALLAASTARRVTGETGKNYRQYFAACYHDWLRTQEQDDGVAGEGTCAWLNRIPEINCRRMPEACCIDTLSGGTPGSVHAPINGDRGCGGLLRVAPVGLFFGSGAGQMPKIDMLAAEAAAMTHGHELGYLPAAVLAHILHCGAFCELPLDEAIEDALETVGDLFPAAEHWQELERLIDRAAELADEELDDLDAIRELGNGHFADEALAIALYCALKYRNDFEHAVIAAVNHSGNSSATGALTGAVIGAFWGIHAVPMRFLRTLEMLDIVAELADDLYTGCRPDPATGCVPTEWAEKYLPQQEMTRIENEAEKQK